MEFPKLRLSLFALIALVSSALISRPDAVVAQQVQFSPISASIDGGLSGLTNRETTRVQRFLSQVFPTKALRRFARETDRPTIRRVYYTTVTQTGGRYILAGFTARWHEASDMLAIFKLEKDGITEVWRSKPWEATYYGMNFSTARFGRKSLVLFREGIDDDSYSLASLFTFQSAGTSLFLHDITPSATSLSVVTRFPFRPLYAQSVSLRMREGDKPSYVLSASDGKYSLGSSSTVEPTIEWRLNKQATRFERSPASSSSAASLTTVGAAK